MLKLSKLFLGVATGALGLLLSIPAQAIPLLPNTVALAAPEPGPAGTVVESRAQAFAGPGQNAFTGTLFSAVLAGDLTNPFVGGLTFVFQLQNNAAVVAPGSSLGRLTIEGFEGFQVDASFFNIASPALSSVGFTSGGTSPFVFDRSLNGDVVGSSFVFNKIKPGTRSSLLVFQTNATRFELNASNVINGSVATTVSLSPAAGSPPVGVPDGGSALAFLGIAMVGIEGLRRKLRLA